LQRFHERPAAKSIAVVENSLTTNKNISDILNQHILPSARRKRP